MKLLQVQVVLGQAQVRRIKSSGSIVYYLVFLTGERTSELPPKLRDYLFVHDFGLADGPISLPRFSLNHPQAIIEPERRAFASVAH